MKKSKLAILALVLVGAVSVGANASAHGVWFAQRIDHPTLVLGEGPLDNAYEPSMVKSFEAYDVGYNPLDMKVIPHEHNVTIDKNEMLGTTATTFDYGYFTKDKDGKTHRAMMKDVPNAVKSTHAVKYNVTYWNAAVKPERLNMPIEIVPSVNPLTLRKGDTYEIQVFKDGMPYANAPLIKDVINDLTNESQADAQGKAMVTVSANGLNVVGVEVAFPTATKGEQTKYFSSLSFTIKPE